MTVSLAPEKAVGIYMACLDWKKKRQFSIWDLAKVIGEIVAAFPGESGDHYVTESEKNENHWL